MLSVDLITTGEDMLADSTCVWLGDVLLVLMQQAGASGLASSGGEGPLAWPSLWDKLFGLLLAHVEFLHKVIAVAREGGPEQQRMVDVIRSMVPKSVMSKALAFTNEAQRGKLRPLLLEMTR